MRAVTSHEEHQTFFRLWMDDQSSIVSNACDAELHGAGAINSLVMFLR